MTGYKAVGSGEPTLLAYIRKKEGSAPKVGSVNMENRSANLAYEAGLHIFAWLKWLYKINRVTVNPNCHIMDMEDMLEVQSQKEIQE